MKNKLKLREMGFLCIASALAGGVFLLASLMDHGMGFPLDDSWIHQTYARNLAMEGEWAFRPGIPSAGSTAPLWSALLSFGYALDFAPYAWTYFLGMLTLFGLACICEIAFRRMQPAYCPRVPWVGLVISTEWHLIWAGMSGMETLLHGLVMTAVLALLMTDANRVLSMGLLSGIAIWIRPDGITLLGPVFLTLILEQGLNRAVMGRILKFLLGFCSIFVVYLLFNLSVGGTPMPNTFYAKQAEYQVWQNLPILTRLGQLILQLITGPGLVLLPGYIVFFVQSVRRQAWGRLASVIWVAGYLLLYTSRLPVYQHGRYIMPALPALFLMGCSVILQVENGIQSPRSYWRFLTAWRAALALLLVGFLYLGSKSYAQDVAVIESEMVATARWIAGSLPGDAVIAAHDIGALGFFDDHELIDLAGLVSPEVIPFMRNEPLLARYLEQQQADYLVAFPDFYPLLVQDLELVYTSGSRLTQEYGRENMGVYRLKNP